MQVTSRSILFGQHADWMPLIASRIDRHLYAASFAPLAHVNLEAFDAVVPLQLADYRVLAAQPGLRGRRFLLPDAETVRRCDDKLALARFLIAKGFGRHVPAILSGDRSSYPRIRRPRRGEFGRGACIVLNAGDDAGVMPQDGSFEQAYIPGVDEFVLHAVRHDGRIRFAWALHHRMAGPHMIRGAANAPERSREIDPSPALAIFAPMLAALDYEGTCSIDFKVANGILYLLEINPRVGGSLTLGINAYVGAYLGCLTP